MKGSAIRGLYVLAVNLLVVADLAAQAPAPGRAQAVWDSELSADSEDGTLRFASLTAVTILDSTSLLIADAASGVLRLWRLAEGSTRTVGSRGQGPGEYRLPVWIDRCGSDSVFVWDAALSRLSVLDASLRFVRSVAVTGARSSRTVACDGNGRFAIAGTARHPREGRVLSEGVRSNALPYTITELLAPIYLLDADGARQQTLPDVVLGESIVTPILPGEPLGGFPRPFGFRLSISFVDGLLAMTEPSGAIALYGGEGPTLQRRLDGAARVPIAPEDAAQGLAQASRMVPAQILPEYEAIVRDVPLASAVAPTRLVPCDAALLCYVVSAPGAARTELALVGAAGEPHSRLRWDGAEEVLAVGNGLMVLRRVDEGGDERLVVVRHPSLAKARGRAR